LLVLVLVELHGFNSLAFLVFGICNIKSSDIVSLLVKWIDEMGSIKLEVLPPFIIGSLDFHFIITTVASDVQ
jgi:hypothetical protein